MVAHVQPAETVLEDLNGPLPYWGPAADDAKTAVHHAESILRRSRTQQRGEGSLGDLNGPLAYWGPSANRG
jgi:hypothetical protein